ncbi:alpha-glucosidase [Cohnella sp. GCM10012308]|uniref:glycoside hydrolase family 13 protein n=1 Tax=Cohnella sp. GCM10012308 TaxID=3317329 RepID=UPI00360D4073
MKTASWWKEAVVYQIYPASFRDSDGDGIGDLNGITQKLDYIRSLGVDVIWLCPVYRSPGEDSGYDISDYRDVMPTFGTMADLERLLQEAHGRGIRIIMDLVVNHTSDEHPWFVESRSSKTNPKRDYYIWREGRDGREPNNWRSYFSSSAWSCDEATGEYYLHLFSKKQPDLNWKNPALREEIYEMMRFWLDKGFDGFRMDTINLILKAEGFPDSDKPPATDEGYVFDESLYANQPGVHELLREMNERVLSRYDLMTVGETLNVTPETAADYVRDERRELHMICNFELMSVDSGPIWKWDVVPWQLRDIKRIVAAWQTGLHGIGWNSLYLNNHDQPRMVSRFGDDGPYRVRSAKMLATLLHTLQGTPFIYQGEELGMTNVRFESIGDYRDVETLNFYREATEQGVMNPRQAMEAIYRKGRDNVRTPMQWNAGAQAGFTEGVPWIGLNPNYKEINAERALEDPDSVLAYYRRLLALRKAHPVIVYGEFEPVAEADESVFAYTRRLGDDRLLVVLNFFGKPATLDLPPGRLAPYAELLIANLGDQEERAYAETAAAGPVSGEGHDGGDEPARLALLPYEARVYRWSER